MHWSEAVQFCSKHGLVLKKSKLGLADKQIETFWTRLYKKESDFINLYDESDVNQTLCQSCNDVCKFEDCNMTRIAACESNVESICRAFKSCVKVIVKEVKERIFKGERDNEG
uniref:Uncharacterized protein n=1 Tax=Magallana gigas TaxID=29159 RepID=A0A8W8MQ30_MAGGI